MATCVTWKQPDANHFNGFCTNKFRLTTPPYDVRVDNGCEVCAKPEQEIGVCNSLCSVPFLVTRQVLLDLRTTLSDTPYGYPYVMNFSTGTTYHLYDKFTPGAEVGSPCTLTATLWNNGVNEHCTWRYEVATDRWYRFSVDTTDFITAVEIVDAPIGTQIANPFTPCVYTGSYPKRFCVKYSWGYFWELSINATTNSALLRLQRPATRHWIDPAGAAGIHNIPVVFPVSNPSGSFLRDEGPTVYNYTEPARDFPGGPLWPIFDIGDIVNYRADNVCQSGGRIIMAKTYDASESFNYASGRAIAVPTGFPSIIIISMS